ncbi:MAG: dihydroflavonol-4-reductase [Rhodothermales bacterium]|jgi:dihydroflavonol-4-reductase
MSSASTPKTDQPVLVTGGTGFVGSHLVEALHARGYDDVRCLIRSKPGWLSGIPHQAVRADLGSVDDLAAAMTGCSTVYHVAGRTRARSWEEFEDANVQGTLNLLQAASSLSPAPRVQIVSSLAAVGAAADKVATENTPLRPVSMYGRSKAVMEDKIQAFRTLVPITVVRPPAVYGPRDADIFTIFKGASRGVFPVVGGSTGPALSLVHVTDLVRGMIDAAESPATVGNTYFLGADPAYSWAQVKDAAARALNRRVFTLRIPESLIVPVGAVVQAAGRLFGTYPPLNREKALEIRDACIMCSSDRARLGFGYTAGVPLVEGFADAVDWYKGAGWL